MPEMTIQPWRSRPVFVSSTFKDMQAERDHLKNVVFPELAERLRGRRNHLDSIDLRLGVETVHLADEAAKELRVLKVCLNEIERSRPFLIVLLGDRYGWVPPAERMEAAAREAGFQTNVTGRSVTDLEIDFGLLKKDPAQRRRSFFYFRDPLPYDQMSPDVAARYSDLHSPDPGVRANHPKLIALKARIENDPELKPRVRSYEAKWNAATNEVTDLEAWGRKVLEDLWGELDQETAEQAALAEFVEFRSRNFIGRVTLTDELLAFARSASADEADWGLCITGEPGAGKSALFAHLYRQLRESTDVFLLAHAAGISTRAGQVDDMLRRWIQELADHLGIAAPLDDSASAEDIEKTFAELLGRASTQRRVVMLIDALNQFTPSTRSRHLTWLPPLLPPNARLIATAIAGTETEALGRRRGARLKGLEPLSIDESREIAVAICEHRYHRKFHDEIYDAILAKKLADGHPSAGHPAAGNPLWLWLAMEELNLLDADSFDRAERDYAELPADRRLHQLLLDTVASFPADVEGLYAWMLKRSERVFGQAMTRGFAGLIAVSRFGWRESDLREMLPRAAALIAGDAPLPPVDDLLLASLRRSFRAHVIRRGELDQWDFLHLQMRQAVRQHGLPSDDLARRLHAAIADYLETLAREDPLHISEIMFHYIGADDRLRAARYYGSALTAAEESAGTDVLAAHLLAEPGGAGSGAIEWVAGLPGQPGLTPDEQANICSRFNFDLDDRLATTAPLAIRQSILRAAQVVLTNLATSVPGNAGWQRDLSVSHGKVGDVLSAQGNLAGALAAYRATHAIVEHLAEQDPGNAGWQRDLSLSHGNVGDVLRAQGNLAGALAAYRASLAIAEHLAEQDPGNAGWQHDLSVSHLKVGDVLSAQGNLAGALAAYRASLAIAEHLAEQDPGNAGWQRDLSVSHNKVGDVLSAQGNLAGALAAYRVTHAILEHLAEQDPGNAGWQRDLVVSHYKLGQWAQSHDPGSAAAHWRKCYEVMRRMRAGGMFLDPPLVQLLGQLEQMFGS